MPKFLNLHRQLRKEEMQLLEDTYSQTEREILLTEECGDNTADDLVRVFVAYNECVTAQSEFVKKYPAFDEVRLKNCDSLNELGKSLNLDRKNSNIARLVGNVTSFIGGTAVLASAVLAPIAAGLAAALGIVGASWIAIGSATSSRTSLAEFILVNDKVKKTEAIVDSDSKALGDLTCWLEPACELAESLDRILKIDLMRDMMNVLCKHIEELNKIKRKLKSNTAIQFLVGAALMFLPCKLSEMIIFVAALFTMMPGIMLHDHNRLTFDYASLIVKSVLTILSCLDSCTDVGTAMAQLLFGDTTIGKNVGKALIRGTFAIFSMSLDFASIILTSIDVHNGSLSKEGQLMIETAEKLKEQNDEIRMVFETLKTKTPNCF